MPIELSCDTPIYRCLGDLNGKKFHIVTALDVIEHIQDDRDALQIIYNLLKPNGELILIVPAYQHLYSPIDQKGGHYRRYTRDSMATVVEAAGFRVKQLFYFFPYLYLPCLIIRKYLPQALSWLGVKYDLSLMPKIVPIIDPFRIPSLLTYLELKMIQNTTLRSPFGVSLFAHAVRK